MCARAGGRTHVTDSLVGEPERSIKTCIGVPIPLEKSKTSSIKKFQIYNIDYRYSEISGKKPTAEIKELPPRKAKEEQISHEIIERKNQDKSS